LATRTRWEDSPILIRLAEREDDVSEFVHDVFGGMVHEPQRALVIGLYEVMFLR
jgi:hypothetical protein